MKRLWKAILLLILWGGLGSVTAMAGEWPKIEAALSSWEGPKRLLLRSALDDPLASPVIQCLLEDLLAKGFLVTPASPQTSIKEGLILDFRLDGESQVLALSRGEDGAIIAFEKKTGSQVPERRPAETAPALGPAMTTRTPVLPASRWSGSGPIELPGHPRSIALLGVGDDGALDFALLYDHGLESYRRQGAGLQNVGSYRPPLPSPRALHLSAGDLDGDGRKEIAAVWTQDVVGIYEGTDSQLHGWILGRGDGRLTPLSPDLSAYLRILGGKGYLQCRGPYAPFAGPVFPLIKADDGYRADSRGVDWAGANLYQATPLDNEGALVWNAEGNLQLLSLSTGKVYPGAVLLQNFAAFTGPEVAVRREIPEYRSGLEKQDRVKETYYPLPGRVAIGADGAAYTVLRGRTKGLPLLGRPAGSDAVGRVVRQGERLNLEKPFAEIETFIIDIAPVIPSGQSIGVLLLLNEKEDGSGRAYLHLQ